MPRNYKTKSQKEAPMRKGGKSKSKRRVDDEKENIRVSISPKKNQEPRSATRSRSDKKRKPLTKAHSITGITTVAQIKQL